MWQGATTTEAAMNKCLELWLVLTVAASAVVATVEKDGEILVLTQSNFEEALKENPYLMVEFYAPWCGHCKTLAPEYATAAVRLVDTPFKLAKVDGTVEKQLGTSHEVQGFPTLFYYQNSERKKYTGGRTAKDIIKWLKTNGGVELPPASVKVIEDVDEAKAFAQRGQEKGAYKVTVLGFYKDSGDEGAKDFKAAAQEVAEYADLAITHSDEVRKAFGVEEEKAIIAFNQWDEKEDKLVTDLTKLEIEEFIKRNLFPHLPFATRDMYSLLEEELSSRSRLYIFKSKITNEETEKLTALCKKFKARFQCMVVDSVNAGAKQESMLSKLFGITNSPRVQVRLHKRVENFRDEFERYMPDVEEPLPITEEAHEPWIRKAYTKELKPFVKSAELPDDWDQGPVTVLVGENFDQVARDRSKNVLVEFYAPWCGHCKKLEPIFNELGENYKDNDKAIVIAKIDATANDAQGVKIKGYPTIKFFPFGSDEIVDFRGPRTLEGFSNFLDKNVVKPPAHEEL